jgi:hypothetical protein
MVGKGFIYQPIGRPVPDAVATEPAVPAREAVLAPSHAA